MSDSAYIWLWETLAQELGEERAQALQAEYKARQRQARLQVEAEKARVELPDLRRKLEGAERQGATGLIKKYQAMVAKRERVLAEVDEGAA